MGREKEKTSYLYSRVSIVNEAMCVCGFKATKNFCYVSMQLKCESDVIVVMLMLTDRHDLVT